LRLSPSPNNNIMSERNEKVANVIKEIAAEFLVRENNRTSLITVSSATVSADLKRATIFITVMPEDKEHGVLEFVKRKRSELRDILKKNMAVKNIPFIDFAIDKGEKNRQKIDELLREK
jgi:ribosome-binding factor A